jgi:hypothetical protein
MVHVAQLHQSDLSTRIVEKMGVWSGSVRIDIAVINAELSGYELKSDRDTLRRLPMQAEIYSRVFDQLTLVVGSRHAEKAADIVPNWWGVMSASDTDAGVVLKQIKCGTRTPSPDPYLVADLLWKDEALAVLEFYDLAKGWRSKSAKALHQRLASELSYSELSQNVRKILKRRDGWLGQSICN